MTGVVIRAEILGKLYRIGKRERYKTFHDTLTATHLLFRPCSPYRGHSNAKMLCIECLTSLLGLCKTCATAA